MPRSRVLLKLFSSSASVSLIASARVPISGKTEPNSAMSVSTSFGEERLAAIETEGAAVFDGAAEDAAEDVVASCIAGKDTVGDGEAERADVVGDDSEAMASLKFSRRFLGSCSFGGIDVDVGLSAELFRVCGRSAGRRRSRSCSAFCGEVGEALGVLDERAGALEAHAGVDVLWRGARGSCRRPRR